MTNSYSNSETDIANAALIQIGASTIAGINDSTNNARKIRVMFDLVRREVFTEYNWPFSKKSAILARQPEPLLDHWEYSYKLPGDMLHLVEVHHDAPYLLIDGNINTNDSEMELWYIRDVVNPAEWTVNFTNAFIALLRAKLTLHFTQSTTAEQTAYQLYQREIGKARTNEAQQRSNQVIRKQGLRSRRAGGFTWQNYSNEW